MNPRLSSLGLVYLLCVAAVARVAADGPRTQALLWRNVAIKGGGFVSGLAYHPAERDLLYARTDVGGAYRWKADSKSWVPLNDGLGKDDSQLTGVVSLALDPHDANRVYLACGQYLPSWAQNAAILRSADRGVTWSRASLPLKLGGNSDGRSTGERLQVDPNSGAVLLLGTNQDGLWKSTDGAVTWSKVAEFAPASVTLVVFDPRSGTAGNPTATIYVGVNTTVAAALYRSTDGGASWVAVSGQPAGLMPQHAKLGGDGFLYLTYGDGLGPNGLTKGAVWKLRTADDTWTNISPPTGQGGFAGLALDGRHPGTLAVSTLDRWSPRDELYRSTDGGATWRALNALSTRDVSSAPYAGASTPHWIGALEIDPFDSARAFYVTGFGLFGTETLTAADVNGPVTWFFRNDGLEETVPLGLVSPPSGAPLVSVLGDIDGFRHDDLTVSPPRGRHSPSVGTNNSIDFAERAPNLMVRTHGGGSMRGSRSTDGGATWSYFGGAPAPATANRQGMIAISADGAQLVWAPTGASLYESADNGNSWTPSTGGPAASTSTNYTPVADRANATRFYVYDSSSGRGYASSDGGGSFALTASGLPTGAEPLRAAPGNEGHLWLAAWGNGLYRSTNAAAAFAKVAGVSEAYRIGFGKAAPGASYPAIFIWGQVGGVTGIFRSDDEAATWTRINDDAQQFAWINAITGDPRGYGRVYLATGGRGIVYGDLADVTPTVAWSTPQNQAVAAGANTVLAVAAAGDPAPSLQWRRNGSDLAGATGAGLVLTDLQPANAGLYTAVATSGGATTTSEAAILAVATESKVIGAGVELLPTDIHHPNGNVFDQVLLTGAAETITADFALNQITRTSFIDLDDDIVQVEFSGPGTLSLVLDHPTGPAPPVNYNQTMAYMRGHAGIVIVGADDRTNVSVFSVGRITAVNQALFKDSVTYGGIADIAFIAIASTNGKFGGVRTANANYFATKGLTGVYAPGVTFQGPVYLGNVTAFDAAAPVIVLGGAIADTFITGGDLFQADGRPVTVSGLTRLKFTDGSTSHGAILPARLNRARLQQNGADVTTQIVVNPGP